MRGYDRRRSRRKTLQLGKSTSPRQMGWLFQIHRALSVCDDCIVERSLALLVNCYRGLRAPRPLQNPHKKTAWQSMPGRLGHAVMLTSKQPVLLRSLALQRFL